jgi:phage shock protein B
MDWEPVVVVATLVHRPALGKSCTTLRKWKTAATITSDDEVLLEELYNLAKRLDQRMETVERLVASDDPGFTPARRLMADHAEDNDALRELEQLIAEKKGTKA